MTARELHASPAEKIHLCRGFMSDADWHAVRVGRAYYTYDDSTLDQDASGPFVTLAAAKKHARGCVEIVREIHG